MQGAAWLQRLYANKWSTLFLVGECAPAVWFLQWAGTQPELVLSGVTLMFPMLGKSTKAVAWGKRQALERVAYLHLLSGHLMSAAQPHHFKANCDFYGTAAQEWAGQSSVVCSQEGSGGGRRQGHFMLLCTLSAAPNSPRLLYAHNKTEQAQKAQVNFSVEKHANMQCALSGYTLWQ
jgi:hypothetical protein